VDPGPFTARELMLMAEGRGQMEWGQTACILAMFYNANRPKEKPAMRPDDFNPYAPRKRKPIKVPLASVIPLLIKG
jgi:hypothetical protein